MDGSLGGVILTMGNEIVIRLHSKGSSLATIDRLLRIAVMFQLKRFSLSCRLFSECNWIKLITKCQEQETEPIKQPVASLFVLLNTEFSWLPCLNINIIERSLHLYKKELIFKGLLQYVRLTQLDISSLSESIQIGWFFLALSSKNGL